MSVSSPYVVFRAVDLGWPLPPSFPAAQAGPVAESIGSASAGSQALKPLPAGRSASPPATQASVAKAASGHRRKSPSRGTSSGRQGARRQGSAPLLCWQGDLFLSPAC
ncbi:MAG: hypothetical protein ACKOYK_02635 [Cyanobium sp.]